VSFHLSGGGVSRGDSAGGVADVKRARWQGPMGPIVESLSSIAPLYRPSVLRITNRAKVGEWVAKRTPSAVRGMASGQAAPCPAGGRRAGGRGRAAPCNPFVNQNSSGLAAAAPGGGSWPSLRRSCPGASDHCGGQGGARSEGDPPKAVEIIYGARPGRGKCRSRCCQTARRHPKPLESWLVTRLRSFLVYVNSSRSDVRTFNGESRKMERLVMPQKARKIA
jgi:hypothetical protein